MAFYYMHDLNYSDLLLLSDSYGNVYIKEV